MLFSLLCLFCYFLVGLLSDFASKKDVDWLMDRLLPCCLPWRCTPSFDMLCMIFAINGIHVLMTWLCSWGTYFLIFLYIVCLACAYSVIGDCFFLYCVLWIHVDWNQISKLIGLRLLMARATTVLRPPTGDHPPRPASLCHNAWHAYLHIEDKWSKATRLHNAQSRNALYCVSEKK